MIALIEANLSFVVLLSAGVLGIGVIWRRVVVPLRTATLVQQRIWAEFRANSGESLHDKLIARLDRIDGQLCDLAAEQKAMRKEMELFHSRGKT